MVDINHSNNLFAKEPVETNHISNMLTKELVKFLTRGLIVDNLIEKITNCSLFNQELVDEDISDMMKKQPVDKILVSLIFMQINDVLLNLVIGVSFLKKVCPESHVVFQAPPLIMWLQYKEPTYLLMCLFIFSLWNFLYFSLHQDEEMSALDQLREREQTRKKVELRKQKKQEKKRTTKN